MRPNGIRSRLLQDLLRRPDRKGYRAAVVAEQLAKAERMRLKAERVAAFLKENRPLHPLPTHAERLARLQDKDFLLSEQHQAQGWIASDDLKEAHDDVQHFFRVFLREAYEMGIPIYCRRVWGDTLEVLHSQFHDHLSGSDWEIMGHLGIGAARRAGLKVRWVNADPAHWEVEVHSTDDQ